MVPFPSPLPVEIHVHIYNELGMEWRHQHTQAKINHSSGYSGRGRVYVAMENISGARLG